MARLCGVGARVEPDCEFDVERMGESFEGGQGRYGAAGF
jgi:hypothetical protein